MIHLPCTQYNTIRWTSTRQLEDLEFADDLCLLSHKVAHRRQKVNSLRRRISLGKTKKMRVRAPANAHTVKCREETTERVERFCCLGSVDSSSGGTEEDGMARKRSARQMFATLSKVWKSKLRIFNSKSFSCTHAKPGKSARVGVQTSLES